MTTGRAGMTGLVLAGGGGRRMGRDKATMMVDDERLVDRAVRRLADCCEDVLVAPGHRRPLEVAGARTIADAPGEGPLAGIVGGLQQAQTELLAVIAVDMPHASAAVLRALAATWAGEAAVVPVVGGTAQPLHAVYAVSWTDRFAALLDAGEPSAVRVLELLGAQPADATIWGAADPAGDFAANLNTPDDLAALGLAGGAP